MKKLIIINVLLFFSANYAISACVLTGGACSIENIRNNNKNNLQHTDIKKDYKNKQKIKLPVNKPKNKKEHDNK